MMKQDAQTINWSNGAKEKAALLLKSALDKDNEPAVCRLLALGLDPNAKMASGIRPLSYCIKNGKDKMAQILLSAGADPNADAGGGFTVLMMASWIGNEKITQELIGCGAMVDKKGTNGTTPLMVAARKGQVGIAKILAATQSDLEVGGVMGWRALHWAASSGNTQVAQVLIEAGADTHAKDIYGNTPLNVALKTDAKTADLCCALGGRLEDWRKARAAHGEAAQACGALIERHELEQTLSI